MNSKKIAGVATAAPKLNGLPTTTPRVVVVEEYDQEEQVLRLVVVRIAA